MHKSFLITRALHQATALSQQLTTAGYDTVTLPCIEIITLKPSNINSITQHISDYDFCIFTSTNVIPALPQPITLCKQAFAIGPATAEALQSLNIVAKLPSTFSSEGLLDLTELQNCHGKRIAIFTGEAPRPLLKETLTQRGATVEEVICYKRLCPTYTEADLAPIVSQSFTAIICMSPEIMDNLVTIFSYHQPWLWAQPVMVISEKMQQHANQLGFKTIYRADNTSCHAIITTIANILTAD